MRDRGQRCDLALEIKKILQDDLGLQLIDEIVLTPPHSTNMMRARTLYEAQCKLVNGNSRIVVAWKGHHSKIPAGSSDLRPPEVGDHVNVKFTDASYAGSVITKVRKRKQCPEEFEVQFDVDDEKVWVPVPWHLKGTIYYTERKIPRIG
eukprot:COSAG02_NODE_775_length_17321_cov_16.653176_6_plen_149_part_00